MNAEELAQRQLEAYNARDLDAFLACYAPDVELADLPENRVFARGIDRMREIYDSFFRGAPDLHCRLVSRISVGRFAVDQEEVTGVPGRPLVRAAAVYEAVEGKIRRVWFLRA
jgi:hypothetical protein